MNIERDPGCAPGFERSVNAEPGPMGAGAGAAAGIDNNVHSPRGAAIEKFQAELRRDLAVREERRRELEFLEKGGEPLDFKFGGASLVSFPPLSPKEPFVRRLSSSKSEEGAGRRDDVVVDGDSSNGSGGCVGAAGEVEDMSILLVSANEKSCSRLSSLNVGAGDASWTLSESASKADTDSCQGVYGRSKGAGHVNRNRLRSQRVGNGHALPKDVGSASGGDGQVVEAGGTVTSAAQGDEGMVDMSYQVLPQQSQHGLPGKWNGLTTNQDYEPVNVVTARCGPVLEQHASDHTSRDRGPVSSVKSLQTFDARVVPRVVSTGRDCDGSAVGKECSPHEAADRADSCEQGVAVGERRDNGAGARQVEGVSDKDAVDANSTRVKVEDDVGSGDQGSENRDGTSPVACSAGVDVEKSADPPCDVSHETEAKQSTEARSGDGILESRTEIVADGLTGASAHSDPRMVKKGAASSRGGIHLRLASRDRPGVDEKKVSVHHVRVKSEEGAGEDGAKHLATQAEPGGDEMNGAHCQELRTGAQAGAVVGGAGRSMGRSSSNSGTPNRKDPGVVAPWVKGEDSAVQAEAGRHNAELREKLANKAHEDYILEEAEHLKAKRKLVEERKTMKRFAEPSWRKSHWDYVLEEMKWMANDFWQERMWKRYQAAQVCLEIAMKKGEDEFLAADLTREQHRISSALASGVKDFWHTAEVAMTSVKADSKSSTHEHIVRGASESEVVPMDVDFPDAKEGSEKWTQFEKGGKEKSIGVQKYAIRLLKEAGFQRMGQADPPSTPERHRESNSVLEQVHQVALFYEVPMGSMEAYRAAVEAEHARSEEEYERRRAAATAEAEAVAAAEAAEDASAGGEVSYADLSNDGGSQEDEPAIFTTEGSRIYKKKRKKIFKTGNVGSRAEGSAVQGLPYRASALLGSESPIPSPVVTGKRSFTGGSGPNGLPGSIPVKRARSSAANSRPRGTQPGSSPGFYMSQKGAGSQFQQDEELDMVDGSNQGDGNSDSPGSRGFAGDGRAKQKKKKTRAYSGLPFSDGGMGADTPGKNCDGIVQELRHEQMKRKPETHWVSIGGPDAGLDTPGTPGSQGVSGQQNWKKQKSVRQGESSAEAVYSPQTGQQVGSAVGANKLMRQNSMRDRNRRARPSKVAPSTPTGVGIPWSAGEDKAILALVHDLGPNWELVSDVLSSSSQIKGIWRKPVQCKERHKWLTERVGSEGLENSEDPSSSQQQGSKGNLRGPRGQSAGEEDALKHFEQIVSVVQKYGARKNSGEAEDQKVLQPSHPSHGITISQFGTSNPVDLADRAGGGDDPGGQSHPAQPSQGNVQGPPMVGPLAGLGMRPPAGGLPLAMPGTNGLHLGQGSGSPAAMSAAAARDAQRYNMSFSSDEAARLQMGTSKVPEFRARQHAGSGAAGVGVLGGLGNTNGLPMLSSSASGGMVVGLNRGMAVPRAGLAGMGSAVGSPGMGTAGLSGRLPPSGNLAASNASRRIGGLVNITRNAGCTEEQRLQALHQLQLMAQQGDAQAASALSNLTGGGDMGNSVDGLNQSFSLQHQHTVQVQQQQQQQHQEQHQGSQQQQLQRMNNTSSKSQAQVQQQSQQQMQLPGTLQGYVAVPTRMKEQQQQQQQQQRHQQQQQQLQKQRLLGNLPPSPQPHHMLNPAHQAAVPRVGAQHVKSQSHSLAPQQHSSLQKQLIQQAGSPSPGAQLGVASASLQSTPASPGRSVQEVTTLQQNERAGQVAQGSSTSARPPQDNRIQKQVEQSCQPLVQQAGSRNSKGVSRGAMSMQGLAAQPGQVSGLAGGADGQLQGEAAGQMQAGQRGVAQSQSQGGKVQAGSQAGNQGGYQSQGGQLQGAQPQTASSVVGQQKGPTQQQSAQGGVEKQQQGASSQPLGPSSGQLAGPGSTSSQQPVLAASSGGPNQQSEQLHRHQVAQAQAPRRLPTKYPGITMGVPIPGQVAKTGVQGGPSQMPQASQNPYQFGGTMAMGMRNPNLHGMAPSSALSSSAAEAQSTQWKPKQSLPPLGGGMYSLTRSISPGPGQGPAMASSGPHSNGNLGISSLGSSGVQGAGLGNTPLGVGGVQGAPGLLNQKLGVDRGMNGRGLSGAERDVGGGQLNQPSSSVSGVGTTPSSQGRPPAGSAVRASPASSSGVGVSQGGAAAGSHQGVPVATSGVTASSGQVRQAHGEQASASSSLPSSQRAVIPGASGGNSSVSTGPPAAADQGPGAAVEPTPAPS